MSHVKTLARKDIVLFTVSAILLLDTLAASATIGPASIFWWLFLGVVFFLPYALICAEMGTTYPEQGGLYAWIRDAFGRRWASRATWAYWVNTAVWMPAVFILFAGIFAQIFNPDMSMGARIALSILLTWVAVGINVITLDIGKWIPNLGALFKILIIGAIIVGAINYTLENGMANPLTIKSMTPAWGDSLQYFSVIIYGMLGFELVSAGSEEMQDPARDVPSSILISGLIIIVLYVAATASILAAIPVDEIDLVEGLVDTLYLLFGGTALGNAFALLLGIGALYTFFANNVTWSLGCNRAMAQAAREREFPRVLGRTHARLGTPTGAAFIMGLASTAALLLYGLLAGSNEELFWSLFAFSAVIFLIPYIVLVFAFVKMRYIDGDRHRPFRVPGGNPVATLLAIVCALLLALALLLFLYTPGSGVRWPVCIGAVTVLAVGEIIIRATEKSRGPDAAATTGGA
ncbi:MAG: APC family permease [Woeseia sp.]